MGCRSRKPTVLFPGVSSHYAWNKRLGDSQSRPGRFGQEMSLIPARNQITIALLSSPLPN